MSRNAHILLPAALAVLALGGPAYSDSPPPGPMTIDQVVGRVLSSNSSVLLAREQLRRAKDQIRQAYAEAMPQVTASIVDTVSSPISVAPGSANGTGITLPGGGAIPVITDQGGSGSTYTTGTTGTVGPSQSPSTSPSSPSSPSSPASGQAPATSAAVSASPAMLQQYAAATSAARSHAVPQQTTQTIVNEGSNNNYAARFSVNEDVDLFGIVRASVDVLNRTRDFYAVELDRVSNELALTTKTDFFTVLRDQANVQTDQEQVDSAQENLRIVNDKLAAGTAAKYDVLTAQTTVANDQQALLAAQNQLSVDQATLNSLLGYNLDQPIVLTPPALPALDAPIDLNADLQRAYHDRPELRQAESNIAISRQLVKLNGATLLPALTIAASANFDGPVYPYIPSNDYALTAEVSVPLFDGGATKSRVQVAKSTVTTEQLTRDQLRQNVTLEVRQAYLSILTARASVGSAQVSVGTAAEAARLADVRYRFGQGTYLDVINAQAQLATARTNLATAEYNLQTYEAQLLRAEGGR